VPSDHWRPRATAHSFRPLIITFAAVLVIALFGAASGASSSSASSSLLSSYPFVIGLKEGWCSQRFLEPIWGARTSDAVAVCQCESHGVPTAVSDGIPYYGLFQIDPSVHGLDPDALLDPVYNSWIAATLQGRDGWTPWPVCAEHLISA
jgi:hypothetical protein